MLKELLQSTLTQITQLQSTEGGLMNWFNILAKGSSDSAGSLQTVAKSAQVATAGTQAMVTTQSTLAPVMAATNTSMTLSAGNYAQMATGAQEAAIGIANLAIANAANSVASIPILGAVLAPIAALATSAAITAAWGMTSVAGLGSAVMGRGATAVSSLGKSSGGGGGTARGVLPAPVSDMPKYHSGGLVPGTKEQIALLKGGERVLNPAENASYSSGNEENGENSINNVMLFNIKAWDGKDVISTLKANSQTINQIVSSGIKNNQQGLRTTVQNI